MPAGAAAWRLLLAFAHLLRGLALMRRFPRLDAAARQATIRAWSAGLLQRLGIELEIVGQAAPGAALIVANHVSWLDIAAIHAVLPQARFVSKADVQRWPLLGWLVRGAGTLFIERDRKRDALRVVHAVAAALAAGDTVAVFPEGTTGAGSELLPFHANLLQAAIATATPVQPVVLRFDDARGRYSPAAAYVGTTTLVQSVWRVVRARGLRVRVELLAAQPSAGLERRALAQQLRTRMAARLGR
ncbi:MAG: 1-acyl-sn-glycerol-3-phosphate acyltransferase [Burkholderiales bacterium]|nr:1-acyl-sn-glycerol-3-phosphate acyltransferase [Burkholderiales bacterium]MDE1927383.1 1-acyl-sn-glycerol-3-phosphate acyltransferase [Burkholderiales bacterium]MDE2158560.1 1-acyl-sn-glycerol-3-phosphate acyltransferase [Burkholderiales bacterium]MDE2503101.1 1-acyl-sn-glycerol-3-phosphate acyltransferase [Burkholderiales bacterium]